MLSRRIALLTSVSQKTEVQDAAPFAGHQLLFADSLAGLLKTAADAYVDLTFENTPGRISTLKKLSPAPIFINSVIQPLPELDSDFIRINGWAGFLGMPVLEAAAGGGSAEKARNIFGEYIIFVKDVVGLVTPRIISMIINEAYFVLAAGTGTREEIDVAMKLGTGYPMGPFEWAEKIGMGNIRALLKRLSASDPLYIPATGIGI